MKLINTDMDTLFFSGQMVSLSTETGKESNQVGLTVTLGEKGSATIPNQFVISDGGVDGGQLVNLNLSKAEFTLTSESNTPTLNYTKKKRKDIHSFLVTGSIWSNVTGNPNVEGLILLEPEDITIVRVLASGVNTAPNGLHKITNSLLLVPTHAYYYLDGQYYQVSDDKMIPQKPKGVYVSLEDILLKAHN